MLDGKYSSVLFWNRCESSGRMDSSILDKQCHIHNNRIISATLCYHIRRYSLLFSLLIIVGWPSDGGSVNASVASITNMQYFLDHFPSTAKNANVTYYWFEGYDEPWKVIFNTATASYEDKWVKSYL